MRHLIFLLVTLGLASPAYAGLTEFGTISHIIVESQYVQFDINGARIGAVPGAPCSSVRPQTFAFRTDLAGGEGMMAMLLTAFTSKMRVAIRGKNTCTIWTDTEDLMQIITE